MSPLPLPDLVKFIRRFLLSLRETVDCNGSALCICVNFFDILTASLQSNEKFQGAAIAFSGLFLSLLKGKLKICKPSLLE